MLPGWPLALLLQTAQTPQALPPWEKVQASVLLVRGKLGADHGRQGSGVVIAPHLVATNAHVVEGATGLTVQQGLAAWKVTTVRLDPSRDLCLLTVPDLTVPPVDMAGEPPEIGQDVVTVGYPGGHGPVTNPGRLRGIWYHEEAQLLQSDAITLPGNSGGGLFDGQGRLLGLTTLTFAGSPRLNFSVPVVWIKDLALQPIGEVAHRLNPAFENHGADLLERLTADARNWPAWESAARQWVRDLPMDDNAWLALGFALDRSSRVAAEHHPDDFPKLLSESVEAYRRSIAIKRSAKAFNNLGVALDLLTRFKEAEQAFLDALALEPSYAMAWLNLASARFDAGHFASAAEAFRQGLALRPDEAEAWIRLAHSEWLVNQKTAAVATLQIGLRYRPLVREHWLDLGLWLVEMGRLGEAHEVHARLIDMDPEVATRLQASLIRAQTVRTPTAVTKPGRKVKKP